MTSLEALREAITQGETAFAVIPTREQTGMILLLHRIATPGGGYLCHCSPYCLSDLLTPSLLMPPQVTLYPNDWERMKAYLGEATSTSEQWNLLPPIRQESEQEDATP